MRVVIAAIFSVLWLACANAAPPLPREVQAVVDDLLKDCSKPKFERGFITRKDINGDGIIDFILDHGYFTCDGSTIFCGSGGCTVKILASIKPEGYSDAFSGLVQDYKFTRSGNYPAIKFNLHGSYCGKAGSEVCQSILYWNGTSFTPAH